MILSNWPLKIWSFVIGSSIFFLIHSLIQAELLLEIPLEVVSSNGEEVFHVNHTPRVKVELRGTQRQVETLNRLGLKVLVPLDQALTGGGREGTFDIRLAEGYVSGLPDQIQARFPEPSFKAELKQMKTRQLSVTPVTDFTSEFDVKVRYPHPQFVDVRGPRDVVEKLKEIKTRPARDTILYSTQNVVEVDLVDQVDNEQLVVEPRRVKLWLDITPKQETHELKSVPVNVLVNPEERKRVDLQRKTVDLIVTGPPVLSDNTKLLDLDPDTFTVFVDVRGLQSTVSGEEPERKVYVVSSYGDEVTAVPREDLYIRVTVEKAP